MPDNAFVFVFVYDIMQR